MLNYMKNSNSKSLNFFLKFILIALSAAGACSNSFATHVYGSYVHAQHLTGDKYKFSVVYYRHCGGVSMSNPQAFVECAAGGSLRNVTLTLESIEEISLSDSLLCNPQNTQIPGSNGKEKHTFSTVIDFGLAPFSSLASCSDLVRFRTGQCCRTSDITSGAGNAQFQTFLLLDIGATLPNSSPNVVFDPVMNTTCNTRIQRSFFGIDPDGDSLAYKWGHPKGTGLANLGYAGTNLAYNHPFTAYYPFGTSPPYNDPTQAFPIGIYLNSQTGEFIYTPTYCTEVTVAVMEIEEWRDDGSGTSVMVGLSRLDITYTNHNTALNVPPSIVGSSVRDVDIKACLDDASVSYIIKDSLIGTVEDTVSLILKKSLPSGVSHSFTRIDTAKYKLDLQFSAQYFYDQEYQSHTFFLPVEFRDNGKPFYGINQSVLQVNFNAVAVPSGVVNIAIIDDLNKNCLRGITEDTLQQDLSIAIQDTSGITYLKTKDGVLSTCVLTDTVLVSIVNHPWYESSCGFDTLIVERDSTYDSELYSTQKDGVYGFIYANKTTGVCSSNDSSEVVVGQQLVLTPGDINASTDRNGMYLFPSLTSGTYTIATINVDSSKYVLSSCVDFASVSYSASTKKQADTLFQTSLDLNTPRVLGLYSSLPSVRRGGRYRWNMSFAGLKDVDSIIVSASIDPSVVVTLNNLDISAQRPNGVWVSLGGNQFTKLLRNPLGKDTFTASMMILVPQAVYSVGDTVNYVLAIDSLSSDNNLRDNAIQSLSLVIAPYDPNTKFTSQDSIFTVTDRELDYTIVFQNTGEASAIRVVVKDTLGPEFDIRKIRFGESSHPYTYLINDREISFIFDDINLPDSGTSAEGSIGHVSFSIPIFDDIFRDTIVANKASIYFDFEDAIVTNTKINTFKTPIEYDTTLVTYCQRDTLELDFWTHFYPEAINEYYLEAAPVGPPVLSFSHIDTLVSFDTSGQFSLVLSDVLTAGDYVLRVSSTAFATTSFEQYYKPISLSSLSEVRLVYDDTVLCKGMDWEIETSDASYSEEWFLNGVSTSTDKIFSTTSYVHNDSVYAKITDELGCEILTDTAVAIKSNDISIAYLGDTVSCFGDSLLISSSVTLSTDGVGSLSQELYYVGASAEQTMSGSFNYFQNAGLDTLILKAVTDLGCEDSIVQPLVIGSSVSPAFVFGDDSICLSDRVTFIDGSTSSLGTVSSTVLSSVFNQDSVLSIALGYAPTNEKDSLYQLTVTNEWGCIDSIVKAVGLKKSPTAAISSMSDFYCSDNLPVILKSSSSLFETLTWDYDGSKSSKDSLVISPSEGNYTIELVASNGICSDTASMELEVQDTVSSMFGVLDTVCQNAKLVLVPDAVNSLGEYTWNYDGVDYVGDDFLVSFDISGESTIKLTTSKNGKCNSISTKNITVVPIPEAGFVVGDVCLGERLTVYNLSPSTDATFQYVWGDGMQNNEGPYVDSVLYMYSSKGTYAIEQIVIEDGCSDTFMQSVEVLNVPVALFYIETIEDRYFDVELINQSSDFDDLKWSFGDGNISSNESGIITHTYDSTGEYWIRLIASNSLECSDTFILYHTVKGDLLKNLTFYVPNSFSPNEDGINETYNVQPAEFIASLEMKLYNRWGQLVEVSERKENILSVADQGLYLYTLIIMDLQGERHVFNGTLFVVGK